MTLAKLTPLLATTLCMASCHGTTGSGGDSDTGSDDSISLAVDSIVLCCPVPALFPDTVYPSAKSIVYKISGDTATDDNTAFCTDLYTDAPGAFTFRKGTMRQADFAGEVKGTPAHIRVDWKFTTGQDTTTTRFGRWGGGTGWTGQPLYVQWPDSCASAFRKAGVVTADFDGEEIIIGSLASEIYFLNPATGKQTRNPIEVGNPVKGTPSLDPTLNGNLYIGHGVPAREPFGTVAVNMFSNTVFHTFDRDDSAWRRWDAYDSSPLRVGKYLYRPGENGSIYKFEIGQSVLRLHSVMRYLIDGNAPGIEASMGVYLNYGFTADNCGNILAINLRNLKPVCCYKLGDDIDATPVLAEENDSVYLYTGCEIDMQGEGQARFVKLNAADGSCKWMATFDGMRFDKEGKHFDGGFYASALPGTGNCSDLIFTNCVFNTDGQNGALIALDRDSGELRYSVALRHYAWSSPVSFLNENNQMFILTADTYGFVYLINGMDGTIIDTLHVGGNFESSPVVFGNSAVVGSRGNSIYKLSII